MPSLLYFEALMLTMFALGFALGWWVRSLK